MRITFWGKGSFVLAISQSGRMSLLEAFDCLATGALFYYLTSLIPILGVIVGDELLVPPGNYHMATKTDVINHFANWDGFWYKRIATEGYQDKKPINTAFAFFPAYPLLGRWGWSLFHAPESRLFGTVHE
ncbi:MAG: hypothetical protein ACRELG_07720, partial [Gemmataceae bacterium]